MDRPRPINVFWIVFVVLCNGAGIACFIAASNSQYLRDYQMCASPDAKHYVILGRNFWERGVYSRMSDAPFTPDVLRTPVYPLVAGGLDLACGGAWAIYTFQLLCRAVLAVSIYVLGCSVFGRRVAFIAALLLASNLTLAVLDFQALSESLFSLLAGLAVMLWLREISLSREQGVSHYRSAIVGLLLALAILTRPTGLYLPLVLAGIWAVLAFTRQSVRLLIHAGILLLATWLCVTPWVVRNYVTFGIPHLTTAEPINLIYFSGAGAYAIKYDVSLTQAQEMIHKEYGLVTLVESNNYWKADRGVAQIDTELRAAAPGVLLKYPRCLTISSVVGIAKALLSHNVASLADMAGKTWTKPGMSAALSGDLKKVISQLARNDAFLIGVFAWEILIAGLLLVAGAVGLAVGLLNRSLRLPVFCLLPVVAYYLLTIAVVGLDAYTRHRSMLVPFFCIFTGIALNRLFPRSNFSASLSAVTKV